MEKALFVYLGEEEKGITTLMSNAQSKSEYKLKRVPQLGFQYLCAMLSKIKVESEILDQSVDYFSFEQLLKKISNKDYIFIGFYSDTTMKGKVKYWIEKLRENGCSTPILVGGPGFFSSEEFLKAGADIVCIGEGEFTILEIVRYLKGEITIHQVKGISLLNDGKAITTSPQPIIENLDELPFPCRDKVDINKYQDWRIVGMRKPFVTMLASRGCFYNCTFCAVPSIFGRKIRRRSVSNVIAEIDEVVHRWGVKYIGFRDDMFGSNLYWLDEFCNKLYERKYDLRWSCQTHPLFFRENCDKKMDLFKKGNCNLLILGLQSVSKEVLRNIKRSPEEVKQVEKTVLCAKKRGINTVVEFIIGLPGETQDTIKSMVKYALTIRPTYAAFYPLMRIEGTEIYNKYGGDKEIGLTSQEIEYWSSWATRKFFSNLRIITAIFFYAIKNEPKWLLKGAKFLLKLILYKLLR